MEISFIHRTIRTSIVLSCFAFLAVWLYFGFKFGGGIVVGTAWGCLNLYAIALAVKALIVPEKAKKGIIILILVFKFPLIYFIGYLILRLNFFPILSLLIGFTVIFLVMALKALNNTLLTETKKQPQNSVK
jgi:hypothetical protein